MRSVAILKILLLRTLFKQEVIMTYILMDPYVVLDRTNLQEIIPVWLEATPVSDHKFCNWIQLYISLV